MEEGSGYILHPSRSRLPDQHGLVSLRPSCHWCMSLVFQSDPAVSLIGPDLSSRPRVSFPFLACVDSASIQRCAVLVLVH